MTAGRKRRLARAAGLTEPEGMGWRSTLVAMLGPSTPGGREGREVAGRLMRRLLRLERAAALSREPYVLVITKGTARSCGSSWSRPARRPAGAGGGVRWRGG